MVQKLACHNIAGLHLQRAEYRSHVTMHWYWLHMSMKPEQLMGTITQPPRSQMTRRVILGYKILKKKGMVDL